jgi:hypothetical protein
VRVDSTFRGGSDGEGKLHEAKRMAFDETVLGTCRAAIRVEVERQSR